MRASTWRGSFIDRDNAAARVTTMCVCVVDMRNQPSTRQNPLYQLDTCTRMWHNVSYHMHKCPTTSGRDCSWWNRQQDVFKAFQNQRSHRLYFKMLANLSLPVLNLTKALIKKGGKPWTWNLEWMIFLNSLNKNKNHFHFKAKQLFYFLTFVVILNNKFSIETFRVLLPSTDQYLCIMDSSKDKELSEKSHCDKATENC